MEHASRAPRWPVLECILQPPSPSSPKHASSHWGENFYDSHPGLRRTRNGRRPAVSSSSGRLQRCRGRRSLFMTGISGAISLLVKIAFATMFPGHILPCRTRAPGGMYLNHRHGYLCFHAACPKLGVGMRRRCGVAWVLTKNLHELGCPDYRGSGISF